MDREKKRAVVAAELFRISKLSAETADLVLPMIKDETLKTQVLRQRASYRASALKSAELLKRNGLNPSEKAGLMERAFKQFVQADTAWDKSTRRIAKLAADCTAAAMKDLAKTMDRSGGDDTESRRLAEEYLDAGQKDMDFLKKFL